MLLQEAKMLRELDCVKLIAPLSEGDVPMGSEGVVLMVYKEPPQEYEVEFFDSSQRSLGTFTTDEDHIEKLQT
jgi:hypothetical protein